MIVVGGQGPIFASPRCRRSRGTVFGYRGDRILVVHTSHMKGSTGRNGRWPSARARTPLGPAENGSRRRSDVDCRPRRDQSGRPKSAITASTFDPLSHAR